MVFTWPEPSCEKAAADRAVELGPCNDLAWHILARWHQLLSHISGFKKAIALNPPRLMHYVELGRTYAQMGETDQAREYLKKGLAMPDREKDDPDTKKRGRETLEKLSHRFAITDQRNGEQPLRRFL